MGGWCIGLRSMSARYCGCVFSGCLARVGIVPSTVWSKDRVSLFRPPASTLVRMNPIVILQDWMPDLPTASAQPNRATVPLGAFLFGSGIRAHAQVQRGVEGARWNRLIEFNPPDHLLPGHPVRAVREWRQVLSDLLRQRGNSSS